MAKRGPSGPERWTSVAPRLGWLPVFFGLLLIPLVGILVLVLVGRGDPGTARVVSTSEDSANILVLDGPSPRAWRVSFLDASEAEPGQVVDVRLRGDCGCEPHADVGSPVPVVVAAVVAGALFILSVRLHRKVRRIRTAQLRSLAAAEQGAPHAAVVVRPHFSPGSIRDVRLWLEVLDASTGHALGWVDIRRALPAFDPSALSVLLGDPTHGARVALATADGSAWALPAGPLEAESGPVASWSSLAVEALGWDRIEAPVAPTVGGDRRLSIGALPSGEPSALREVVRSRPAGSTATKIRGWLVGVYAACLVALFVIPIPWNLIAIVAALAMFVLVATRQQEPMRAAVHVAAPDLGRQEVNVVAGLLLALGGEKAPTATAPTSLPPPSVNGPGAAF